MAEVRGEQVGFEWVGRARWREGAWRARSAAGHVNTRAKVARPPRQPQGAPAALPPLPPDDELWDVRAAARFLKRSVSWVYHRVEDGTLPVRRPGGWELRSIPGELRAWVESGGERRSGR